MSKEDICLHVSVDWKSNMCRDCGGVFYRCENCGCTLKRNKELCNECRSGIC